ncbi:methylated-DNA--[protein]-cysteine S-methyltransferase [Roseibium hamelinense]|uniref:methylated-DNA--[protein]-cysteine S-methyltransferase n=1 Tax=Roseibium hamelinense TaxID=150831 RepID=UPI001FCBF71D|nr:methylated-DNA--[protein]-cysteine S-methyltransferase [Roseibium hamelinense]
MTIQTPVGDITVVETNDAITQLVWGGAGVASQPTPLLNEAGRQLKCYFDGTLTNFDLPLNPSGSNFLQSVFSQMIKIPYGETRTYGQLAERLNTFGQPVGQACGANPVPIIIPCHRVLSANGLGGYSGRGGPETKIALLRLEGGYPFLL